MGLLGESLMLQSTNASGRFIVQRDQDGHWQATLHNATLPGGIVIPLLQLAFERNVWDLLIEGSIPKSYGGSVVADYRCMLRGSIRNCERGAGSIMCSIVYCELVEELAEHLVAYVLRLDGGTYEQQECVHCLPAELAAQLPVGSPIRVKCRFRFFPMTHRMMITPLNSDILLRIPSQAVSLSSQRLQVENPAGSGGTELVFSGTGIIDGQWRSQNNDESGSTLIIPKVITFDCGTAVHRLWLSQSSFRWYIDEDLVVPIP